MSCAGNESGSFALHAANLSRPACGDEPKFRIRRPVIFTMTPEASGNFYRNPEVGKQVSTGSNIFYLLTVNELSEI
jgi:hypothetical protein